MTIEDSVWVDINQLRVGLYIELDVGWMAHPFPTGSFKITSTKQLDAIRALGLSQVRIVPSKSDDVLPSDDEDVAMASPAPTDASKQALQDAQERQRLRSLALANQDRHLVVCERRFGESLRLYRKATEQVLLEPKAVAQHCQEMVGGYVADLLDKGEASIRLLSEMAGDKSAMHPVNVTVLSLLLGKAMGLQPTELQDLGMAAFLHDIGKIKLPDRVRWVDEGTSTAEYRVYQEHVSQGVVLAKAMELRAHVQLAMAQHHELADGSGFPARIRAEDMSAAGKILALVNRYDNLCNPSRVASALTPHEALSLIYAQLRPRFDASTLSAFIRMMGVYPPGSVVQLIDDRYAMVVSVNSARPLKPSVIVHDPAVPKHEALILDLEHAPKLGIRRSLKPSQLPSTAVDYLAPRHRVSYFFDQEDVAAQAIGMF